MRKISYTKRNKLVLTQRGIGGPPSDMTADFAPLVGSKIISVGLHPDVEEGGFAIDYEKDGELRRFILGFTELGCWVEWEGKLK